MKKRKSNSSREGGVLIAVMIMMIVVAILGVTKMKGASRAASEAIRLGQTYQKNAIAEMGMSEIRALLMNSANYRDLARLDILSNEGGTPTLSTENDPIKDPKGRELGYYKVYVSEPANDAPEDADYEIKSIAYSMDDVRMVDVKTYLSLVPPFEDVWGTNFEGGVRFTTGDHIYGSIMSNGPFTFWGNPIIEGSARTGADYNYIDNEKTQALPTEIFQGDPPGSFGQPAISFNEEIVSDIGEQTDDHHNGDITIDFQGTKYVLGEIEEVEETYSVWTYTRRGRTYTVDNENDIPRNASNINEEERIRITEQWVYTTNSISDLGDVEDDDNIIFVNGSATVSGEVGGVVSVAATDSIIIDGNIVYSSAPGGDPDPLSWNDMEPDIDNRLGLYAQNKVMVLPTYGQDINVHAAMYVSDPEDASTSTYIRGFCVYQYDKYWGKPEINLYGSIIQNRRGAVGTSGGNGFFKNYHQDKRLLRLPPPGNPLSAPAFFGWKKTVAEL